MNWRAILYLVMFICLGCDAVLLYQRAVAERAIVDVSRQLRVKPAVRSAMRPNAHQSLASYLNAPQLRLQQLHIDGSRQLEIHWQGRYQDLLNWFKTQQALPGAISRLQLAVIHSQAPQLRIELVLKCAGGLCPH